MSFFLFPYHKTRVSLVFVKAFRFFFLFVRNIVENMFLKLEKYSASLEAMVHERTTLLQEERRKTDALLERILPV